MQTHDEYEPKSLFDLQRTCSVWHWQLGVAEEGDQGAYSVVSIKRTGGNKGTGWGEFSEVVKETGCIKRAKTGKTTTKP